MSEPARVTLNQAIAVLKENTAAHQGDFGIYHEGAVHCQVCGKAWPCPTVQAGELLVAALETHQALVRDCDRLEDGILRALDQIVGWCGQPTTDPVEIVDRIKRILTEALATPAVGGQRGT